MLSYEKGEIYFMSEVESGTSQSTGKPWSNMTLVIMVPTSASTFKYLAFKVSGDRVGDVLQFQKGDKVEVGYAVSGREYNGKWYANVDLVNIKADEARPTAPAPVPARQQRRAAAQRQEQTYRQAPAAAPAQATNGDTNDLPF